MVHLSPVPLTVPVTTIRNSTPEGPEFNTTLVNSRNWRRNETKGTGVSPLWRLTHLCEDPSRSSERRKFPWHGQHLMATPSTSLAREAPFCSSWPHAITFLREEGEGEKEFTEVQGQQMLADPVTSGRAVPRTETCVIWGLCVCGGSPASRQCVIRAEAARRGAVSSKQPGLERRGAAGKRRLQKNKIK